MPRETKLNIPFRMLSQEGREHPGVEFHFIDHPNVSGGYYGPESKAKEKFRKELTQVIDEGLRAKAHTDMRVIACKDGTALVVSYRFDAWGYVIAGDGRKYLSGTSGLKSLDEAMQAAKNHAEQSFGGILWEN